MKTSFVFVSILLLTLSVTVGAQNTVKLFDANLIAISPWGNLPPENAVTFGVADVYLACPVDVVPSVVVTGPNGGPLVVDNFLMLNGNNICGGPVVNCFSTTTIDPMGVIGSPVEAAFVGINPIDISGLITGNGVYTFNLKDYGYVYGSSEIYLTTNCSFGGNVCHRNFGRWGGKTLDVSPASIPAHLAHGDTLGPCPSQRRTKEIDWEIENVEKDGR